MQTQIPKQLQNLTSLIQKQSTSIKSGGKADKLASAIKQYQFSSTRTTPLSKHILDYYFASLLLSHHFIQLQCAVKRNVKGYSATDAELYYCVGGLARKCQYVGLIAKVKELKVLATCQLKEFFLKAVKAYILKSLARNYINIQRQLLEKNYGITKEDIESNGCRIEDKFVVLEAQTKIERIDDLLKARIGQVSEITESIAKM